MLINDIELYEDSGSPRTPTYRFTRREGRVVQSFQLRGTPPNWVRELERVQAFSRILGFPRLTSTPEGQPCIRRQLPIAYPTRGSDANPAERQYLFAAEILSSEPAGRAVGTHLDPITDQRTSTYEAYRIEVAFEAPTYFIRPDADVAGVDAGDVLLGFPDEGQALLRGWNQYSRYVTKRVRGASQNYTIRNVIPWFVAQEGQARERTPYGFPMNEHRSTVEYTWHEVPVEGIPEKAIAACRNKINADDFDGYYAGTLLLLNVEFDIYHSPLGVSSVDPDPPANGFLCDVKYTMLHAPKFDFKTREEKGHNSFFRVKDVGTGPEQRYWRVSTDGTLPAGIAENSKRVFQIARFQDLFRPDQPTIQPPDLPQGPIGPVA